MSKRALFFIFLILNLGTISFVRAEVQNVFPATDADVPRLIETVELMSFIEQIYAQDLKKRNLKFKWNFDWNQNYLGAGSNLYNGEFSILLYGGFVRAPESGFSVVALTLCHEMGHLLAGAPFQRLHDKNNDDWSSAEGQSDWFAATSCLPRVYDKFKNKINSFKMDQSVRDYCAVTQNFLLCEFIVSAGLRFSQMNFKYFNTNLSQLETEEPRVHQFAQERPTQTLHSRYPTMQCRLDTFKAGAFCVNNQSCQRPNCWFVDGRN